MKMIHIVMRHEEPWMAYESAEQADRAVELLAERDGTMPHGDLIHVVEVPLIPVTG